MPESAAERYETVVLEQSGFRGKAKTLLLALVQLATAGAAPANPGGRSIEVIDTMTGEQVLRYVESFGEDDALVLAESTNDLESLFPDMFLHRWASDGSHGSSAEQYSREDHGNFLISIRITPQAVNITLLPTRTVIDDP